MLASIIFALFVLALIFLCGQFTAKHAARRGRSSSAWFLWGALFFPIFPIPSIVLALLPPLDKPTTPPPQNAARC